MATNDEDVYTFRRTKLVEFVREVLGEIPKTTDKYGMVTVYEDTNGLELECVLENREIIGVWHIPLPAAILNVANDPVRNPYKSLGIRVRQARAAVGPVPAPVEPSIDPVSTDDTSQKGRA